MRSALALLLLTGCSALGLESTHVAVPRAQMALLYADARQLYGESRVYVEIGCRAQRIPEEACQRAEALRDRILAIDAEVRTLLASGKNAIPPELAQELFQLVLRYGSAISLGGGIR